MDMCLLRTAANGLSLYPRGHQQGTGDRAVLSPTVPLPHTTSAPGGTPGASSSARRDCQQGREKACWFCPPCQSLSVAGSDAVSNR